MLIVLIVLHCLDFLWYGLFSVYIAVLNLWFGLLLGFALNFCIRCFCCLFACWLCLFMLLFGSPVCVCCGCVACEFG